jgi:tyrosine-protein kinase Etk/Wzc
MNHHPQFPNQQEPMAIKTLHPEVEEHQPSSSSSPGDTPAAKQGSKISWLEVLVALLERKRLIIWITAVCAVLAAIVSLLLPTWYTATLTLLPPQQNSSMAAALSSQLNSMGGVAALAGGSLGLKNSNDLITGMLKSRTVENAMVQHFGLMQEYHDRFSSDACKHFEKHATVDGSGKDGLIHISVEAHSPQRAAELANGFVDEFRGLSEHLAITEASQRRLFFEQQLQQAKENLANAEEALKLTEQKTGLIQLDSQSRALIQSAASLRAEIDAREVQIQGMRTYATSENAELVQAQKELEGLKAQLAKLGGNESSGGSEVLLPKGQVSQGSIEYVRRLRDVKYSETIFDILARQFEIAKLDEARQGALVQVVDPAVPPDRRSFPRRTLIVLGAAVVGFFLAVLLALVQAALEHSQKDPKSRKRFARLKRAMNWKKTSSVADNPRTPGI